MPSLNYFLNSENISNENSLTRAFLILLRYSALTRTIFYQEVLTRASREDAETSKSLPSIGSLNQSLVEIATQKGSLNAYSSSWIISILLTEDEITISQNVESLPRVAVFDGIIKFAEQITLVIENKPHAKNIWHGQVCEIDCSGLDDSKLFPRAIVIPWSVILSSLNISIAPAVAGFERQKC